MPIHWNRQHAGGCCGRHRNAICGDSGPQTLPLAMENDLLLNEVMCFKNLMQCTPPMKHSLKESHCYCHHHSSYCKGHSGRYNQRKVALGPAIPQGPLVVELTNAVVGPLSQVTRSGCLGRVALGSLESDSWSAVD